MAFLLNPTIKSRVCFYVVLAWLGALTFIKIFDVLSLLFLMLPLFLGLAALYLLIYLPLIDWPWLAWRRTGNLVWVGVAFAAALIMPLGAPFLVTPRLAIPLWVNFDTHLSTFGPYFAPRPVGPQPVR